jgi:hypothetical protein
MNRPAPLLDAASRVPNRSRRGFRSVNARWREDLPPREFP